MHSGNEQLQQFKLLTNAKKVTVSVLCWYTNFPDQKIRIFLCHFFVYLLVAGRLRERLLPKSDYPEFPTGFYFL